MVKVEKNCYTFILVLIACFTVGCKNFDKDVKTIENKPQYIEPLYIYLAEFNRMDSLQRDSLIERNRNAIEIMMEFTGFKNRFKEKLSVHDASKNNEEYSKGKNDDLIGMLEAWAEDKAVVTFTPDVESVYPSIEPTENVLGMILENSQEYGLDFSDWNYYAVVWGSTSPTMTSGKDMFIALNHFLGEDYEGYKGWELYHRSMRTPEQLPYAMAETLLISVYPFEQTESSTVLSRLMYDGALIYIKLKIVPNATLASALGYTRDELQWLDSHYKQIMETVIGKEMLYSTSRETAERLVEPTPKTTLISPSAPGRAGRYLGYRLILNFMEKNAKTKLTKLLSPDFYNDPSELLMAQ